MGELNRFLMDRLQRRMNEHANRVIDEQIEQLYPSRRVTASESIADRSKGYDIWACYETDPVAKFGGGWPPGVSGGAGSVRDESPPRAGSLPVPTTLAECDEWIGAVLRLPKGALAKLYRLLYDCEGLRIDSARYEEDKWLKTLSKPTN